MAMYISISSSARVANSALNIAQEMFWNYPKILIGKGYHYPIVLKQGACVNCTLCEMICPDFSIFVVEGKPSHPNLDDVLKKEAKS